MQCECGECGWGGFDTGDSDCPSCGFMIEDFDMCASSSVCTSCGTDF